MSSIATHEHDAVLHHDQSHEHLLRESNIRYTGGASLSTLFLAVAVVGLGATIASAFLYTGKLHAIASFQMAAMGCLAMCLGGMFFTLVMHLMAAGWSITLRRQFENLMVLAPVMLVVASIVPLYDLFIGNGSLYLWMNSQYQKDNIVLQEKIAFLNPSFFCVRLMLYFVVWSIIAFKLSGYSRRQDETGDKWLSNKARFTSAWGMLAFALTTAFASFDLLMSMDFRFFSTMWGVYYFASAAFSGIAALVLIVVPLRRAGKLEALVTAEHFHDVGKLMFTFTVFWAYIAFSQYFLIWYSNVPEETAWYLVRKRDGWQFVFFLLAIGHFVVPFLILLFRGVKRSPTALAVVAMWMLFIHFTDMFFIVRPMVTTRFTDSAPLTPMSGIWVDLAAVFGMLGLLGFLLVRRVSSVPLIPLRDPRLPESIEHKNYI
ncbi:MAG: hypothetical protein KF805_12795 [Phycisphaeraceae bacterium]|nr:hypothetical protein [Phycisphaeraceae bacterium]